MTLDSFTERVQTLFPYKFEDTLMYADDADSIDNILREAYEMALSKYEKIASGYFSTNTEVPEMKSLIKWTPSTEGRDNYYPNVFDLWKRPSYAFQRIRVYLTPERLLIVEPDGYNVYVEYVVDPATLSITDLSDQYIRWAIKYAYALLRIKEGYLGTMTKLEGLSIETNYADMRSEGISDRDLLEDDLNDMCMGTLAIRTNSN